MSRNYRMDNIKFILIALVVFGHFLELTGEDLSTCLYRIIYSFHIPAFLFITGYFTHYNPQKLIINYICPYFIFQTLYLIFDTHLVQESTDFTLQYTTPYWILWYVLVVVLYNLILPFFQTKNIRSQVFLFLGTIVFSLLSSYDKTIGYYMSLARFFTFMPFFIAGYYLAGYTDVLLGKIKSKGTALGRWCRILIILGVALSTYYIVTADFSTNTLYGSVSYHLGKHTPFIKLSLLLIGFCWIAFLLCFVPNKKIPVLSMFGQNTLSIYLLHGFILRIARVNAAFSHSEFQNILLACLLTPILLFAFGNHTVGSLFHFLFVGGWIKKLHPDKGSKKKHTRV